jgi:hypothetical protein
MRGDNDDYAVGAEPPEKDDPPVVPDVASAVLLVVLAGVLEFACCDSSLP